MPKITRREFVAVGAAAGLVAATGTAHGKEASDVSDRSNILLIVTDQQRMECLGAYGNTAIRTPHIDGIARDGVRFTHNTCPWPVCTPSRYSILSGRFVHEHGGHSNHCTLPPEVETFPRILRDAGYRTKAIGKMHQTPTYLDVGFQEMMLSEQNGGGRWDDDYHRELRAQGLIDGNDLEDQERKFRAEARDEYWETFGALPSNLPTAWHSTTWVGDKTVETLRDWKLGGHCLMSSFIKPHHPFDPPKEYADKYDPDSLPLLPGWTDECLKHDLALSRGYFPNEKLTLPALRRVMAHYYAGIEHIDDQVGRMLQTLKDNGQYDNTLIVFTSDHGEFLGYHHMLLKGNYPYEALAKVPLLVKFPGNERAGETSDALSSLIDLAPTFLHAAGCKCPTAMHGLNLADAKADRPVVFCDSNGGVVSFARTKTHKLIVNTLADRKFLYDLEKDPTELVNEIENPAYVEIASTLQAALEKWRPPGRLPDPFVDENAPVIDQPNVPSRNDKHRQEMMAYTNEAMAGDWAG